MWYNKILNLSLYTLIKMSLVMAEKDRLEILCHLESLKKGKSFKICNKWICCFVLTQNVDLYYHNFKYKFTEKEEYNESLKRLVKKGNQLEEELALIKSQYRLLSLEECKLTQSFYNMKEKVLNYEHDTENKIIKVKCLKAKSFRLEKRLDKLKHQKEKIKNIV